jgi:flagellum-specific ATP synthase
VSIATVRVAQERLLAAHVSAHPLVSGRVRSVVGLTIEVCGVPVAIGDGVRIHGAQRAVLAEVVALGADGSASCLALGDATGVRAGAPVTGTGGPLTLGVGDALLGRVLDGLGRPIDGRPAPAGLQRVTTAGQAPHPLHRDRVTAPLSLGVRALDAFTPCGRGQRLGIFAGSGVGKSSLLSMIARGTQADVCVVALVGERGREVREFIDGDLGPAGLARSVVVVATSDEPPLVRLRAAFTATRIAEHFRDRGAHVLLLMDSITRTATAQREVGLSVGEPPATRGYPPSVFALLPRLLERAGTARSGSITGVYTVLVEGDDQDEPIADAARSILDGHVVLSRGLATAGHFPSIDVLESVSRVAPAVTTPEQLRDAATVRTWLAARRDARDLIDIGAYAPGSNPLVDRAIEATPAIDAFLRQPLEDLTPATETWQRLHQLAGAQ